MKMENNEIYTIVQNEIYGRYMVANRSIKQGELIIKEHPVMIEGHLICFKCCTSLSKTSFEICKICRTALLCGNCSGTFHPNEECEQFRKLELDFKLLLNNNQIITPLRLYLIQNYSKTLWQHIIKAEDHLQFRRNTEIWKRNEIHVINILRKAGIVYDEIGAENIQKICGILDVNAFEVKPAENHNNQQYYRGLYLKAALMAHDCITNTHLAVDETFSLYVYASLDIKIGDPIVFNYSNVLKGNLIRREHLMEGKHFECLCKRCLDPTELNTHISSLKCNRCKKGLIQPDKKDHKYTWICNVCSKVLNELLLNTTLQQAQYLIEDTDTADLKSLEALHTKLLQTFHPHHYMIIEIKQYLIGLYTQNAATKENLLKKIDLCQSLLNVFQILEPGISRLQGIGLYQLHSAMVNLAYKEYSLDEINLKTFSHQLIKSETILKSALKHLIYEPKKSKEGHLFQEAMCNLKILRQSITDIKSQLTS